MLTEEEIKKIYYEEYVGQHIGTCSLKRKYHCHIYDQFKKYGLPIRNNREKNKKYTCNKNYFQNIDIPEKAYWLGFIYADGYIGKNNGSERFGISLSVEDINHLYKFKESIGSTHPINTYKASNGYKIGTEYCRIIITEEKLVTDLIRQGCVHHKTNILKPPILPKELRKHWIRGFLDGDGSIIVHKTQYVDSYSIGFTSTDEVLNWIMDELIEDGILEKRYPLTKRHEGQTVSSISFGGNYLVKKFCDYIYNDATICLQRKYERYLDLCKILQVREDSKIRHCCCVCGATKSSSFIVWRGNDEYKDKILCNKHWEQLHRNGMILPDKNDCCDICGDDYGRLIQCGKKYMDYYGVTMCRKHYEQLSIHGTITDESRGWHKYDK